jgi:hypothetical protein
MNPRYAPSPKFSLFLGCAMLVVRIITQPLHASDQPPYG